MEAVLISGSPSATSKSRTLLEHAQAQLEAAGCSTTSIDLATLPADALLGRRVAGRFTITRFLGEGGMAKVFVAERDAEPRQVALKIMNPEQKGRILLSDIPFKIEHMACSRMPKWKLRPA